MRHGRPSTVTGKRRSAENWPNSMFASASVSSFWSRGTHSAQRSKPRAWSCSASSTKTTPNGTFV
eukprot:9409227-Lingulodinium_polyedra.AAC.1